MTKPATWSLQLRGVTTADTPTVNCSLIGNAGLSRSGGTSASASSGEGGWQVIDRSRRLAATEWLDYYPFVMTMSCLLNNGSSLTTKSVEATCLALERFEEPVTGTNPPLPPLIVVSGPVPHTDLFWVCSRLEFPDGETSAIRNATGTRVQQAFTIELTQYSPSVAITLSTLSPAQKAQLNTGSPAGLGTVLASRGYVVKKGDTLQSIAAIQLGTVNLWTQIALVNGLAPSVVLTAGMVITLPVT